MRGKNENRGRSQLAYYVYCLRCRDGSIYTGYTINIERRLAQHQSGKAAKYTRGRRPVELLGYLVFDSQSEALAWEARLKKLAPKAKLKLIRQGLIR